MLLVWNSRPWTVWFKGCEWLGTLRFTAVVFAARLVSLMGKPRARSVELYAASVSLAIALRSSNLCVGLEVRGAAGTPVGVIARGGW